MLEPVFLVLPNAKGFLKKALGKSRVGKTPVFGHIDAPAKDQVAAGIVHVSGWALCCPPLNNVKLQVAVDNIISDVAVRRVSRPDVAGAHPDLAISNSFPGFTTSISLLSLKEGRHTIEVTADIGNGAFKSLFKVPFEVRTLPNAKFFERALFSPEPSRQQAKLSLLEKILACPRCLNKVVKSEGKIRCSHCPSEFSLLGNVPVMVTGTPEFPPEASLLESPASNNYYPPSVLEALELTLSTGGVALDLGSGCRSYGADNLVQVEICNYPFTDVVSQGETLPFLDDSFDFIFSLAVTEHVKRPWILASEIQRILKRGGTLIVDSAFLQPFHGYPHHYYNMTSQALRELFNGIQVESLKPARYQHPWFSISWILDSLLADLPPAQRSSLKRMSLQDFTEELHDFTQKGKSKLTEIALSENKIEELAAGFTLIGKKPD